MYPANQSEHPSIQVMESFSIQPLGLILELKHQLPGLRAGSIWREPQSDLKWRLIARLLYSHVYKLNDTGHLLFEHEPTHLMFTKFATSTDLTQAALKTQEKESQGIYHYLFEALGHTEKPKSGSLMYALS